MLTGILIGVLALIAFLYVALPLLAPGQADDLPDDRDPVLVDLGEEREALFRAIRELDAREDLPLERRQQLHDRYEAKAAKVIKAIDEREEALAGRRLRRAARAAAEPAAATATAKRRVPYGTVIVLASLVAIAALVPSYILPRIGEDATITTTDLDVAQQLQAQRRAVDQEPSVTNLLALGDTYLGLQMLDDAEQTFMRVVNLDEPAPAGVYQRLAIIYLQRDLTEAQRWLNLARNADPNDVDTLFLLGEVSWVVDDLPTSLDAFTDFLAIAAEPEPQVEERVALLEEVLPLLEVADTDPTQELLLEAADLFWQAGEPQRAVEQYFRILTEFDALDPVALARTGQLLYMAGRPDDAVNTIERAATVSGGLSELEPASVRTLADSYLQLGEWEGAATTYGTFIAMVGEGAAADAPELRAAAEARARGDEGAAQGDVLDQLVGRQLFQANCAECHGPAGGGGTGVQLAGSARAANRANVLDAVRFGRGTMPAFQAVLSPEQIEAVTAYVSEVLAVQ